MPYENLLYRKKISAAAIVAVIYSQQSYIRILRTVALVVCSIY